MNTIGRNDPCWCGSGKKYKKCHWKADQQAVAERAAKEQARQARLEALGHPGDAEMRERYEKLTGQPAPSGPLPDQVRETILEMWQQEQLAKQAREALDGEREKWAGYFEENEEEFEAVAAELAQDPYFDRFELTPANQKKVRSQLGPLPVDGENEARREYAAEALAISLDESDREFFHGALLALLPELIEEENMKAAYVVERCADRVLDPEAPISPFLQDVVVRSLTD
ncbi:MAG: SEC-C domain-containing protein [Chloroflexota bacterium]|nr:SEC-C domain-containing protein [Chloroflexota bacterium]